MITKTEIDQTLLSIKKTIECMIPVFDIGLKKRERIYIISRQIFYKIAYDSLKLKTPESIKLQYIGDYLNRDRTTVIHALKNFKNDIVNNPENKDLYDNIIALYRSGEDLISMQKEKEKEKIISALQIENFQLKQKLKISKIKAKNKKNYLEMIPEEYREDFEQNRLIPYLKMRNAF